MSNLVKTVKTLRMSSQMASFYTPGTLATYKHNILIYQVYIALTISLLLNITDATSIITDTTHDLLSIIGYNLSTG